MPQDDVGGEFGFFTEGAKQVVRLESKVDSEIGDIAGRDARAIDEQWFAIDPACLDRRETKAAGIARHPQQQGTGPAIRIDDTDAASLCRAEFGERGRDRGPPRIAGAQMVIGAA
ncbi:MAG: hypothetical protein WC804_00440 [Sphingomonas sp.]|uniref:hypothetical protein n=1 Tax=Sphingomonas sp. TaxID=28214 RepID=UPI00356ADB2F